MPVQNGSFEDAGASAGLAANWTLVSDSAEEDLAVFDDLTPYEGFENGWVMPAAFGNLGSYDVSTDVFTDGTAFTDKGLSDVGARVSVEFGAADVDLVITYTNPDDVVRTGTVTIPGGAGLNRFFPLTLEGADVAIRDVTAIVEAAPVVQEGEVNLEGWNLTDPLNEDSIFVFVDADLFPYTIGGSPVETFEVGWDNDAGFLDDFDALSSALALWDGGALDHEPFDQSWRMPRGSISFGSYAVGSNTFTDGSVAVVGEEPLFNFCRITQRFGGLPANIEVGYTDAAGAAQTGLVTIPPFADVDRIYMIVLADPTVGVRDVTGIVENPDVSERGAFALEAHFTTPPALFNEDRRIALHAFIDAGNPGSFTVLAAINDRLRFEFSGGGTSAPQEDVVAPGVYTSAELAVQMQVVMRALLDVDVGAPDVVGADLAVGVDPDGTRIRLSVEATAPNSPLVLLAPAADSLWALVGLATGLDSTRFTEVQVLALAAWAPENFESGWLNNENSIFEFDEPANPAQLALAVFDVAVSQNFEDFEEEWTLLL